jgi:hypothetical protein
VASLHLSDDRPLRVQLHRVPIITLLLAVVEAGAFVVFEQAMPATEMSVAEGAVSHYPLRGVGALLERADLLLRRAAS